MGLFAIGISTFLSFLGMFLVISKTAVCQEVNDIRLTGGRIPNEGRVEFYHYSRWSTVCQYSNWGIREAHVACRQLGYRGAIKAYRNSFFKGTAASSYIDLSRVVCTGTESYLYECSRYLYSGSHAGCSSNTIVGVTCSPERITIEGSLRLASGPFANIGRIEILLQGHWTTICHRGTSTLTARVACKQLGYSDYVSYHTSAAHGAGRGLIGMQYLGCEGSEENLLACSRQTSLGLFDNYGCSHGADIGASCANNGDIRLTSTFYGRVEVFYNSTWRAVCDKDWDIFDAHVVCRQLGYYGAQYAYGAAKYGQGSGNILLSNVQCRGTESSLLECGHDGLGVHNCTHAQDASAYCLSTMDSSGNLRLTDGPNVYEGRVEVFFGKRWHTICETNWDISDAHTVCRFLGYSGASEARGGAHYGEGTGNILLDNVQCSGSSQSPLLCNHNGLYVTGNCTHEQDAGVECHYNGDARILPSNGSSSSATTGVVQMYYSDQWYTVLADEGWDMRAAQVVCRQLGFNAAVAATSESHRLVAISVFAINPQACNGLEADILSCGGSTSYRAVQEKAVVQCTNARFASPGAVRLVEGFRANEGRVEVWMDGQWGVVCDDSWSTTDGKVVCKQAGYRNGAVSAPGGASYGQGRVQLFLDDVGCGGSEASLLSCSHYGLYSRSCSHSEDAGVVCSDIRNGDIRLANGGSYYGRVEVFSEGDWYTVCDNFWDIADAHVVCSQLGFRAAINASKGAHHGQGSGGILMDNVACSGHEGSLLECPHRSNLLSDCSHANDVGVTCINMQHSLDSGIRLVDGPRSNQGRVELWQGGRWHSVCDDFWDKEDGDVACRCLGYSEASEVTEKGNYGEGRGDIILDNLNCTGNESHLMNCEHSGLFQDNCGHNEDAGVMCQQDGGVRLVGGLENNEGRVEVYIGGKWSSLCGDTFDSTDAMVICKQLGFKGFVSYSRKSQYGGLSEFRLDTIECSGTERGLKECLQPGQRRKQCNSANLAGVTCHSSEYTSGHLRLVNGTTSKTGIVEMFFQGRWSGLCSNGWNSSSASVICKDIGYDGSVSYSSVTVANASDLYMPADRIKIISLSCSSSVNTFSGCSHSGWMPNGCTMSDSFNLLTCL